MDEIRFQEAIRPANYFLENSPYANKPPGAAHAKALSDHFREDLGLRLALVMASEHERWAWDAVSAIAQSTLRHRKFDPLPRELARWITEILEGKRSPPKKGSKRQAKRNLMTVDAIHLSALRYELKPTRNRADLPKCCAEGGSACDVVGAAQNMGYKTVESIWSEWGRYASGHEDEKLGTTPQ